MFTKSVSMKNALAINSKIRGIAAIRPTTLPKAAVKSLSSVSAPLFSMADIITITAARDTNMERGIHI